MLYYSNMIEMAERYRSSYTYRNDDGEHEHTEVLDVVRSEDDEEWEVRGQQDDNHMTMTLRLRASDSVLAGKWEEVDPTGEAVYSGNVAFVASKQAGRLIGHWIMGTGAGITDGSWTLTPIE